MTCTPPLTSILVVWGVKPPSAILKYVKYSAVLESDFPASQQRLEVKGGVHVCHFCDGVNVFLLRKLTKCL